MTGLYLTASCVVCGNPARRSRVPSSTRCDGCRRVHVGRALAAAVHPSLPYSQDQGAQAFVADHPDGATLEEVGDAFGVTRERIRQIERSALESLRKRAALAGIEPSDLAAILARRGEAESSSIYSDGPASGGGYVSRKLTGEQRSAELPEELYSELGQRFARAVMVLEAEAELCALAAEIQDDVHAMAEALGAPPPVAITEERAPGIEREEGPTVGEPKRALRMIEWNGERRSLSEWVRDPRVARLGISGAGIAFRISQGWTADEALTTPKGETPARIAEMRKPALTISWNGRSLTASAWSRDPAVAALELSPEAITKRLRAGWTPEEIFTTPKHVLPPRLVRQRTSAGRGISETAERTSAPATPPQDARERLQTAKTLPAPPEAVSGALDATDALRVPEQVGAQVERLVIAPRGPVVLVAEESAPELDVARLLAGIGCDFEELGRGPKGRVFLLLKMARDRYVIEGARSA